MKQRQRGDVYGIQVRQLFADVNLAACSISNEMFLDGTEVEESGREVCDGLGQLGPECRPHAWEAAFVLRVLVRFAVVQEWLEESCIAK